MSYTCNGNGNCRQSDKDECRYHDHLAEPFVNGAMDLAMMFRDRAVKVAGDNMKEQTEIESAYWRGLENALEQNGDRLQKLRRERDELLETCEKLVAEIRKEAFNHLDVNRNALHYSADIASAVCRKVRGRSAVVLKPEDEQ
jgi:hypothetical protein